MGKKTLLDASFLADALNAEIRSRKLGDIFRSRFLVFGGDFRLPLGRVSHKSSSISPAPPFLDPRGPDRGMAFRLGRFPREFRHFLIPRPGPGAD